MKKKIAVVALALGLSIGILSGCGKPSVEKLADAVCSQENQSGTYSVSGNVDVTVGAQGASLNITADGEMTMDMVVSSDSAVAKMEGSGKASALGQELEGTFDSYVNMADNTEEVYVSLNDSEWFMISQEMDLSKILSSEANNETASLMKDILVKKGVVGDKVEEVNGAKCYSLACTISGEDYAEICNKAMELAENVDELKDTMDKAGINIDDISKYMTMDVTYYIDQKTMKPVKAVMDLSKTDFYGLVGYVCTVVDIENPLESFDIAALSITVDYKFGDVAVEIPADVKENAVDAMNMTGDMLGGDSTVGVGEGDVTDATDVEVESVKANADGSYTLKDYAGVDIVNFNVADGYSIDENMSTYHTYDVETPDGDYVWLELEYSTEFEDFFETGEFSEFYSSYDAEKTETGMKVNGSDVIAVTEKAAYQADEGEEPYEFETQYCVYKTVDSNDSEIWVGLYTSGSDIDLTSVFADLFADSIE